MSNKENKKPLTTEEKLAKMRAEKTAAIQAELTKGVRGATHEPYVKNGVPNQLTITLNGLSRKELNQLRSLGGIQYYNYTTTDNERAMTHLRESDEATVWVGSEAEFTGACTGYLVLKGAERVQKAKDEITFVSEKLLANKQARG